MAGVYSLDTTVIFSATKDDSLGKICNAFIDTSTLDIIVSKTVEEEYFRVLDNYFEVIEEIIKEIYSSDSEEDYDEIKSTIQEVFEKFKAGKGTITAYRDRTNRIIDFIRTFEAGLNIKIDSIYSTEKDFDIYTELYTYLMDFKRKYYSSYELFEVKFKDKIDYATNKELKKVFKNLIKNGQDSIHLATNLEYAVKNDKWVFFITLDEKDLLTNKEIILKNFYFIRIEHPSYAPISVRKNLNEESPIETISKMETPSREIKELSGLINNSLSISLLKE